MVVALRRSRGWRAPFIVGCLIALLALWLTSDWTWTWGPTTTFLLTHHAFPHRTPADIAHHLADFSTLPHALRATPGSWRVEEEGGNFSTWHYRVEWECGLRCKGSVRVRAEALAPLSHSPAQRHRVNLQVRTCTEADLQLWRLACDEMEVTALVESDGGDGAILQEQARAQCGAGALEACKYLLRTHRAQHHANLEAV